MLRKVLKFALLAFTAVTLVVAVAQEVGALGAPALPGSDEPGTHLTLYYFHGDKRCTTCNNMEAYSHAALQEDLARDLESGAVRWRVVNWQAPANDWLKVRYGLLGSSVVLSDVRDGREARFKNLERVWDLAHDRNLFVAYVRAEVTAWRQEAR